MVIGPLVEDPGWGGDGERDLVFVSYSHADGSRLVSGSYDCTIRIWHPTATQHVTTADQHTADRYAGVTAVGWSPDGTRLVSGGGYDKMVRVCDAGSGRPLHTLTGHTSAVTAVGWSPDGTRLVSGGGAGYVGNYDATVRVWEAGSGRLLHTLTGHTDWVTAVGWSPDGTRLVSGSGDETVRVWEAGSGRLLHTIRGRLNRG